MGHFLASAQYYYTGEVQGLHGDKLQHVSITVRSSGSVYLTGVDGDFSIVSRQAYDTLTFAYDGYEQYTTAMKSSDFLQVTLKASPSSGMAVERLVSVISGGSGSFYATVNGGGLRSD